MPSESGVREQDQTEQYAKRGLNKGIARSRGEKEEGASSKSRDDRTSTFARSTASAFLNSAASTRRCVRLSRLYCTSSPDILTSRKLVLIRTRANGDSGEGDSESNQKLAVHPGILGGDFTTAFLVHNGSKSHSTQMYAGQGSAAPFGNQVGSAAAVVLSCLRPPGRAKCSLCPRTSSSASHHARALPSDTACTAAPGCLIRWPASHSSEPGEVAFVHPLDITRALPCAWQAYQPGSAVPMYSGKGSAVPSYSAHPMGGTMSVGNSVCYILFNVLLLVWHDCWGRSHAKCSCM